MKTAILLCAVALSGCASLSNREQVLLAQSKPVAMFTLQCEGYVVMSGMPIPLGTRMPELDALCKAQQLKPVAP